MTDLAAIVYIAFRIVRRARKTRTASLLAERMEQRDDPFERRHVRVTELRELSGVNVEDGNHAA
ncbi:MAG: hypothetical protein WCQ45_02990, partial [bacterium]